MDINQENYRLLLELVPMLLEPKATTGLITCGASPLHIDLLHSFGKTSILSLSQYCNHPLGYAVADPSMMIAVHTDSETVQALSFQNFLGIRMASDVSTKATMNQFLGHWLANLLANGGHVLMAGRKIPNERAVRQEYL